MCANVCGKAHLCLQRYVCIKRCAFTQIASLCDMWLSEPFPASRPQICFCPTAARLPHFLSRKRWGGVGGRMCLFIKTGVAWIFQTGNLSPQCLSTLKNLRVNWSTSSGTLTFFASPDQCDRKRFWILDYSLGSFLTDPVCSSGARPVAENEPHCGKPLVQAQTCAVIVDCVWMERLGAPVDIPGILVWQ